MAAARQSAGAPAAEMGTPERSCGGGEHRSGSVLFTKKIVFLRLVFYCLSASA